MFSATFLVAAAEGLSEAQRSELVEQLDGLGETLGCWHVIGDVLPKVAYQGGDINMQVMFDSQEAYEAAKQTPEWEQLKELLADSSQVSMYQFAAYGSDLLNITDTGDRSHCHRWLFHHLNDGVTDEMVDYAMNGTVHMQDYVEGFNNSLVARAVESEGTNRWDVVFECDFDDEYAYAYPYENHPVHTGYISRFWNAMSPECVFNDDCTTTAIETDGPIVSRYQQ